MPPLILKVFSEEPPRQIYRFDALNLYCDAFSASQMPILKLCNDTPVGRWYNVQNVTADSTSGAKEAEADTFPLVVSRYQPCRQEKLIEPLIFHFDAKIQQIDVEGCYWAIELNSIRRKNNAGLHNYVNTPTFIWRVKIWIPPALSATKRLIREYRLIWRDRIFVGTFFNAPSLW